MYAKELKRDQSLQTSTRWQTRKPYNGFCIFAMSIARKLRYLGPDEDLDSETWKTKFIFMTFQLCYTLVTMAPMPLLAKYKWLHKIFLLSMYCVLIWNGANYYIE